LRPNRNGRFSPAATVSKSRIRDPGYVTRALCYTRCVRDWCAGFQVHRIVGAELDLCQLKTQLVDTRR
jgi:hypothetical protein